MFRFFEKHGGPLSETLECCQKINFFDNNPGATVCSSRRGFFVTQKWLGNDIEYVFSDMCQDARDIALILAWKLQEHGSETSLNAFLEGLRYILTELQRMPSQGDPYWTTFRPQPAPTAPPRTPEHAWVSCLRKTEGEPRTQKVNPKDRRQIQKTKVASEW